MSETSKAEPGDLEKALLKTRVLLRDGARSRVPEKFAPLESDLRHFTWIFRAFVKQYDWMDRSTFFSEKEFLRGLEETLCRIENEVLGRDLGAAEVTEPIALSKSKLVAKTTEPSDSTDSSSPRRSLLEDIRANRRILSKFLEPSNISAIDTRIFWRDILGLFHLMTGRSPVRGLVKVEWTCVCGRKFYDAFEEDQVSAIGLQKAIPEKIAPSTLGEAFSVAVFLMAIGEEGLQKAIRRIPYGYWRRRTSKSNPQEVGLLAAGGVFSVAILFLMAFSVIAPSWYLMIYFFLGGYPSVSIVVSLLPSYLSCALLLSQLLFVQSPLQFLLVGAPTICFVQAFLLFAITNAGLLRRCVVFMLHAIIVIESISILCTLTLLLSTQEASNHPFIESFVEDDRHSRQPNPERAEPSQAASTDTEHRISMSERPSGDAGITSRRESDDSDSGVDNYSAKSGGEPSKDPGYLDRRPAEEYPRNLLWVLALFENGKREQIYVHLNALRRSTDYTLFCGLRQKYLQVSSWWRRFTQLREVTAIRFVRFIIADERRGDVVERDVWPQTHTPLIWLYEPYPNTKNTPVVGTRYLMNMWRDPNHADFAAYDEFRRRAGWAARAKDWLRNAPHIWRQSLRDRINEVLDLDDDGLDPALVGNNLPPHLHPTDDEQPADQRRATRIFTATPKKAGSKLAVNFRDGIYPEAWGLEFEEGFRVHRLLFFLLILYAAASLAILAWLLRQYGPRIPDSLGVIISLIGWVASLTGLMFTVWFKWAENC